MRYIFAIPITLLLIIFNLPCQSQTSSDKSNGIEGSYEGSKAGSRNVLHKPYDDRSMPKRNNTYSTPKNNTNYDTDSNELGGKNNFKQPKKRIDQYEILTDVQKLRKAASKGDVKAKVELGQLYLEGKNVQQNNEEAIKWFEGAAMQGNSDAQFNLGQMYMIGTAGTIDYNKAAQWFKQAANNGNFRAQYNIGEMYITGQGVKQDYKKSADWIEKAAMQGDAYAQYSIALMYENGIGVERDNSKALKWYVVANSLMEEDDNKNIESLAKKMKETEVEIILPIAHEISSRTQNIRNVYSSEEIVTKSNAFIANYYDNLELGYLEYRYPYRMKKTDYGKVYLRMSFNIIESDIKNPPKENEKIITIDNIKMCDRMGSKLSGTAFNIDEGDYETQVVSPERETYWKWPFNPLTDGTQTLNLTISVVFSVFGKDMPYGSKSIEIDIYIDPIHWFIKCLNYIGKNIFLTLIIGMILVIFAFYLPKIIEKLKELKS